MTWYKLYLKSTILPARANDNAFITNKVILTHHSTTVKLQRLNSRSFLLFRLKLCQTSYRIRERSIKTQPYKIPLFRHFCSKARSCQSSSASHIDQRDMSSFHRPLYIAPCILLIIDESLPKLRGVKFQKKNVQIPSAEICDFWRLFVARQYCFTFQPNIT